jgi:hypothetical protein
LCSGLNNDKPTDLIKTDISTRPVTVHFCTNKVNTTVLTARRMRWAGHAACMGRSEVHTGFWWGDLREGDHLEDPDVDGRIILK